MIRKTAIPPAILRVRDFLIHFLPTKNAKARHIGTHNTIKNNGPVKTIKPNNVSINIPIPLMKL
ncbi:MAG: hypothetical protein COA36_06050 [Desulfotalea sp.]|nr:MAG: hypothetical protein COA36_06050 [Desulfotalea sp.]